MQVKRLTMAGSVFLVALSTGYVMQHQDALASRFGSGEKRTAMASVSGLPLPMRKTQTETAPVSPPSPGNSAHVVDLPTEPAVVSLAAPARHGQANRTQEAPFAGATIAQATCLAVASAEPGPDASILLTLSAPCQPHARVEITHGPLAFTEQTDEDGDLSIHMPALSERATFSVQFENGTVVEADTTVPAARSTQTVALQWRGDTGLELHAFEFGATYSQSGHVHARATLSPTVAGLRKGGYMTRLGREDLPGAAIADVYSYPLDLAQGGAVRISVEAEVTAANCGQEVSAETLQPLLGSGHEVVEVVLAIPTCDAIGDFLVLNNVLRDMKMAAN
ncbi:hypothetical protein CLV78_105101 [Aliiruegeria haliotis]|uniref:Translocase n=1 Tax=Aliiruegeria haliotis TaxID=1280846 RepID=A0A2T0RPD9_9RHOB|nr:hypothetical protein [Aliiruegeria haliotis]PRY23049.1 hypothetical protein CLV78_105101 [Aliiruegeria haliotis]